MNSLLLCLLFAAANASSQERSAIRTFHPKTDLPETQASASKPHKPSAGRTARNKENKKSAGTASVRAAGPATRRKTTEPSAAKTRAAGPVQPPRETRKRRAPAPPAGTRPARRLPAPSVLPAKESRKTPAPSLENALALDRPMSGRRTPLEQAGLLADETEHGLLLRWVAAGSLAEELGLRPGDLLTHLGARRVRSRAELGAALAAASPLARAGAVVVRDGIPVETETLAKLPPVRAARDPLALTPKERLLQADHLRESASQVPATLKALKPPSLRIAAGETLWLRFPKGIARMIAEGDVLEARTAMPMTMNADLDFLAVPSGSRLWAQAASVKDTGRELLLRLHVYKIALAGGHSYPCSAQLTDVSGDSGLLRISRGGTLVAAPSDGAVLLAGPERDYQLKFLQPLTISEARGYYLAGPGLWFKNPQTEGVRSFEVTRVVDKRSAQQAGVRVGDRVLAVDGKSVEKLGFQEAISRLYGRPASSVDVRFLRGGLGGRGETVPLRRAMSWRSGLGLTVRREGGAVLVRKILPQSPAEKAGLREGDALLNIGAAQASSLDDAQLRAKLKEDLTGENAPTFQSPGGAARKIPLARSEFSTQLEPELLDIP